MKKKLLIIIAIGILPVISLAQISSNSCDDAETASPIIGNTVYTVDGFDGTAVSTSCSTTGIGTHGEWYKYTPTSDMYIYITSELSQNFNVAGGNNSHDTFVHIFTGTCSNLSCIAGDDDSGYQDTSRTGFSVVANETYYIAWDNIWDSASFDFKIVEIDTDLMITFTNSTINAPGLDRGVVDMNGDHLDDIVSINSTNITINEQQPNGTFSSTMYSTDGIYSASWSMAAADYDRNGYTDLVYGNSSGAHVLKANSDGTAYSVAATSHSVFTQRTNFVDFDNNGDLDIFLCDDVAPNEYFINDGTDLTLWEGDDPNAPIAEGLGLYPSGGNYGSIWIDYDNDGDADLFIAKCGGEPARRQNELFKNNGGLSFSDVSVNTGMDKVLSTWSSAWADFDNDGDMDCFVGSSVSSEPHIFMTNRLEVPLDGNGNPIDGGPLFEDTTSTALPEGFYSFGHENVPYDFNNDGYVDIFSNGNMLINKGDGTFVVYSYNTTNPDYEPREGAVGDLNNDGFLDIFDSGRIKYNDLNNDNNDRNWLKIALNGTSSNINGIGARIVVSSPSFNSNATNKSQIRDVRSAEGFAYMSSLNAHFGLGTDTSADSVTIYWPSGTVDVIVNPTINQTLVVTEGETLGLPSTASDDMILFPNPTKQFLNVNMNVIGSERAIYTVFDITGRRVLNNRLLSNTIDVSMLSSGNYILRIINNGKINTQKFIKQ